MLLTQRGHAEPLLLAYPPLCLPQSEPSPPFFCKMHTHTHTKRKIKKNKKGHLFYKANTYRKSRWFARLSFNKVSTRGLETSLLEICKILLLPHLCSRQLTSHRGILGGSVLNFHPSVTQVWTPWKINLSLDICPQRQIVFPMKLTELSEHHTNKCSPLWGQITPLKNI